jgi:hypothetical protein
MDEKHKAFRKQTTGIKAERRKKKKKLEENDQSTLEDAKRRNPKAFSIQNPIKAQQQFRRYFDFPSPDKINFAKIEHKISKKNVFIYQKLIEHLLNLRQLLLLLSARRKLVKVY